MSDKNYKAYLAWLATCIIWGTTYLAIRIGVEDLPPMLFAGFRWITAGPLFLGILLLKHYRLPSMNELFPLAIIGLSLLGIANGLVVVAEQWVPSGLTALFISTLPFWVVSIEFFSPLKLKLNMKIIGGIFLGLIGVALIFANDVSSLLNTDYLIGILCLVGANISWAAGSVYSKNNKLKTHPLMAAAVQMIIAGISQIILGALLGEFNEFVFTNESLFAMIYLILFGAIIGYGSYIYAIAHLPVSFVTTYAYINPVIALFLGWLILDEILDAIIFISAAVILFGVWLVKKGSRV